MRVSGWNTHFLATSAGVRFAGLFRLDGFDITYRDILAEMRLCFDIPDSISQVHAQINSQGEDEDPWDNLAFAFNDYENLPPGEASTPPTTIVTTDLDQLVPLPPPASPTNVEEPPIIRFRLVRHRSCDLPSTAPLTSHLKGSPGVTRLYSVLPCRLTMSRWLRAAYSTAYTPQRSPLLAPQNVLD